MNWINRFFLALVLVPARLYTLSGVNMSHLRAILTYKLMMDDRRPNTLQAARQQQNSEKEVSNSTLWTMFFSFLMGAGFLLTLQFGEGYVTKFTLYFSLFLVFLCMSLVSDFTSVLIDVRDTFIILPKPVNDRSVVVARLLHIFIYICKLVAPMCLPCFLYLAFKEHIGASFIYLFVTIFVTLFAIFLINAVYILILRFTTPERFKNIISYFQIAFAILIYAGYQFLPRMLGDMGEVSLDAGQTPWLWAMPPYWFASAFETLLFWQPDAVQFAATIMAFAVPLVAVYLVVKFLAPSFNQKLAMISGSEAAAPVQSAGASLASKPGFMNTVSAWLTHNGAEQAGFLFTWKMMLRSRDFKLRVYPSIGYLLVLFVMMFLKRDRGDSDAFDMNFAPIIAVYFSSILFITVISQMAYSEKYKAAWMFLVTPIEQPGSVISGAVKAALVQFNVLVLLALGVLSVVMAGYEILPNFLLAASNQLALSYAIVLVGSKFLPFAKPIGEAQKGGQLVITFFVLMMSVLIGVIHYFLFRWTIALAIGALVSLVSIVLLERAVRKISWKGFWLADI